MTQRTAGLNLEWKRVTPDQYRAVLPNIPDYTTGSSDNFVEIDDTGEDWMFSIWLELVGDIPICLFNSDFGIPFGSSSEEMMQAVDNLSLRDIADMLDDMGYGPIDNPTASRHASRRKANMNLDWEQDDVAGSWFAELPAIPGYPCYPYANDLYHSVQVADQSGLEGTDWAFYMYLNLKNEYVDLYNEDFGIPDTATAEEMMQAVENLDPQEIADVLAENGYMPDED